MLKVIIMRSPVEALRRYINQHRLTYPIHQNIVQRLVQSLMEIDLSTQINATRYERLPSRRAYRNGYRESHWQTTHHKIPIRIPKLRQGTYYPDFLDRPTTESLIVDHAWRIIIEGSQYDALRQLIGDVGLQAQPHQTASLQAECHDTLRHHEQHPLETERILLDVITVTRHGKRRYLAVAHENQRLLAHDITPAADRAFWDDFIRRLNRRATGHMEYVSISTSHHVISLLEPAQPALRHAA